MFVDLHTHPQAHGEQKFTIENLAQFVRTAGERGVSELGFSDHDLYRADIKPELVRQLQTEYPNIKLRLGLEVDYRPGTKWQDVVGTYPYDYLIGSVHEIENWPFDHPDYSDGYSRWQGDDLYQAYFQLICEAAGSGLFQIMGHLDVIRVFNFACQRPLAELARPALECIREAGLAIELNTNGKYKPVQDFYPSYAILQSACQLGIPVTLGSDAHAPEHVARDFVQAVQLLQAVGYKSIVSFEQKERLEYSLEAITRGELR
ncbi:MAG: histidinol-phosphatase HisJ family protein [Peptococcaceae bacterium]|nr:histidinol-phosphatase HisJ family protein [Peptococcaceae bacterium]